MNILILTRYDSLGASSRMRFLLYLKYLDAEGINYDINFLVTNNELRSFYNGKRNFLSLLKAYFLRLRILLQISSYDLVFIEKELFPWVPYFIESLFLRKIKYVIDFDDAIFHNYDLSKFRIVRAIYGNKIDFLMRASALVLAGNEYLASRARLSLANHVQILPTVVDLNKYAVKNYANPTQEIKLVWIGTPSTVHYLTALNGVFVKLAQIFKFKLVVIGARVSMPGVEIEEVAWLEKSENDSIVKCDIGIMPLSDSPWERGKCGYKIIQYMASGLPVVASNIGVNSSIISNGNGFLANNDLEWYNILVRLMSDSSLRMKIGFNGRECVESKYCVQRTGPVLVNFLKDCIDLT